MDFKNLLLKDKKFKKVAGNINSPDYYVSGLKGSSLSFFAANILEKAKSNVVFFLPDNYYLQQMQEDLLRLLKRKTF